MALSIGRFADLTYPALAKETFQLRTSTSRPATPRVIGAFGDAGERHFEKIEATMQVTDGVGLAPCLLRFGHAKVRMTNPLLCRELCGPKVAVSGTAVLEPLTRAGRLGSGIG